MTLPVLTRKIERLKTETKVKNFYSTVNNALRLSMVDNGDLDFNLQGKYFTYDESLNLLNTYVLKYLKYSKVEPCNIDLEARVCIYFNEGGIMVFKINTDGADVRYCSINNLKKCIPGNNYFWFQLCKKRYAINKDEFEPYLWGWNGTENDLWTNDYNGCKEKSKTRGYCTQILKNNNWKFPKNYPHFIKKVM